MKAYGERNNFSQLLEGEIKRRLRDGVRRVGEGGIERIVGMGA